MRPADSTGGAPFRSPSGTQNALILVFSCGLLLLVFLQRVRSIRDVERMLRFIALGYRDDERVPLGQYVSRTPKFLWFYEYPHMRADQNIQGSFINRNHFAQFVALGLGPLFWCGFGCVEIGSPAACAGKGPLCLRFRPASDSRPACGRWRWHFRCLRG